MITIKNNSKKKKNPEHIIKKNNPETLNSKNNHLINRNKEEYIIKKINKQPKQKDRKDKI